MRALVVLACLLAGCLAQIPHQCKSPPLMTGALTVSTQNEKLWTYGQYMYDAIGQRIRFWDLGTFQNQSFTEDFLLLYREGAMYEINEKERTCKKSPLKEVFQPLEVPKDASLLGQVVLGGSTKAGEGILVNTWKGDVPEQGTNYLITMTEVDCIPVSFVFRTKDFGWMLVSFFNNVVGIIDPSELNPPDFCQDAVMTDSKPVDIFSLFHTNR